MVLGGFRSFHVLVTTMFLELCRAFFSHCLTSQKKVCVGG